MPVATPLVVSSINFVSFLSVIAFFRQLLGLFCALSEFSDTFSWNYCYLLSALWQLSVYCSWSLEAPWIQWYLHVPLSLREMTLLSSLISLTVFSDKNNVSREFISKWHFLCISLLLRCPTYQCQKISIMRFIKWLFSSQWFPTYIPEPGVGGVYV